MKSLALAARMLREDSRAPARWLLRLLLAASMLTLLCSAYGRRDTVGAAGRDLFVGIVWTDFWFVTLVGAGLFASVITEEKEQGTLELLELAGFGAPSILLGKSLGELSSAALLLLVQLPFAMLTVTLGGVSAHQVLAAFVLLGAYTLAVYGLALFSSVFCARTASAARLAIALALALALTPGVVDALGGPAAPATLWTTCSWLDPLQELVQCGALTRISATGSKEPILSFTVAMNLVAGALAAAAAALRFADARASDSEGGADGPRSVAGKRLRVGRPGKYFRAIEWREFSFAGAGPRGMLARATAMAALLVLVCVLRNSTGFSAVLGMAPVEGLGGVCATATPLVVLLFVADACTAAGRLFHGEVKDGTLQGLAALPMPVRTWAWAKVRGAAHQVMPSFAALVLVVSTALMSEHRRLLDCDLDQRMYLVTVLVHGAGLIALALHVTVYLSLRLKAAAVVVGLAVCAAVGLYLFWWATEMSGGMPTRVELPVLAATLFTSGVLAALACVPLLRGIHFRLRAYATGS
jgi:ABC-type transport system involved in cytochrome c biogenesis permease component